MILRGVVCVFIRKKERKKLNPDQAFVMFVRVSHYKSLQLSYFIKKCISV